jgi:hypothetical protein
MQDVHLNAALVNTFAFSKALFADSWATSMLHAALCRAHPKFLAPSHLSKASWQQGPISLRSAQLLGASVTNRTLQGGSKRRTIPACAMVSSTQLTWTVRLITMQQFAN